VAPGKALRMTRDAIFFLFGAVVGGVIAFGFALVVA
jgi:surfactin synthase thioesterase subunit